MTDGHYNYKMIFVNINESQKEGWKIFLMK